MSKAIANSKAIAAFNSAMFNNSKELSVVSLKSPIHYNTENSFFSIDDDDDEHFKRQLYTLLAKFNKKYMKQIGSSNYQTSCSGGDIKIQHQQILVASYMNIHTPYRGLVLWHGLGSGKTLSSILISKSITNEYNKIAILPAMLVENYGNEMKIKMKIPIVDETQIIEFEKQIKNKENDLLEKNKQIKQIEENINKNNETIKNGPFPPKKKVETENLLKNQIKQYNVGILNIKKEIRDIENEIPKLNDNLEKLKHYQFIEQQKIDESYFYYTSNGQANKYDNADIRHFQNSLLTFDESQLLILKMLNSIDGRIIVNKQIEKLKTANDPKKQIKLQKLQSEKFPFATMYEQLCLLDNIKIVCLSGTPIINNVRELCVLFNLLYGAKTRYEMEIDNNNTNAKRIRDILISPHFNISAINDGDNNIKTLLTKIDFAKSKKSTATTTATTTQQPTRLIIYKNQQNYYNEFDAKHNYVGMKFKLDNNNTNEKFEQLLTSVMNKPPTKISVEYLFDLHTFLDNFHIQDDLLYKRQQQRTYKAPPPPTEQGNVNDQPPPPTEQDDVNDQQPPPPNAYTLTMTTEERKKQINDIIDKHIINEDEFKKKIRGLLSYFGNIEKIMPSVVILNGNDNDNNRSDSDIKIKVGFDNNGKQLFNIKICKMTKTQTDIIKKFNDAYNDKTKTYNKQILMKLKRNVEHFIYPHFDYDALLNYYNYKENPTFGKLIQLYYPNEGNNIDKTISTYFTAINKKEKITDDDNADIKDDNAVYINNIMNMMDKYNNKKYELIGNGN